MKRLALMLMLLNVCVWYGLNSFPEYSSASSMATGTLPRVAELRVVYSDPLTVPGASEARKCVMVGWFATVGDAEAIAKKERSLEYLHYQVVETERERSPLHWVIIPPQPEKIALAQSRKLRKQGVDSYLVTQGSNRNAISLGLFESREAAISVLEEKKHQNLNAILANFPRNQISYALSFEVSSEFVEKQIQAAEADYGNEFDFVEINTCEGVATSVKNP